jgi:methionyl-tRNA formyltransferase
MRIVFVGTGAIGVPTLQALLASPHDVVAVVTQPDKPVGREQRIKAPPIKQALAESPIAIFQPARIKDVAAVDWIRGFEPDVIVVMAYGQILPAAVLAAPKRACLNVHASLLPKWRGAAPIQASIAAGDSHTGLSVMYMDQGLDTGDILLKNEIEILPNDTGGSVHDRMAELAPGTLLAALRLLELGNTARVPQTSADATYAPKLNRESGRINWSEPAEVIERRIRAFTPWPGAFAAVQTAVSGVRKLKVFSARVVDSAGKPGQILRRDDQFLIAAGERALSLTEVQLEGRKRMSAAEFVRGNQGIAGIVTL